jgi:glycosyltransferase involved in cell wall biosynthesis
MNFPSISCKCSTYGRIDLLEESVHSFLNQRYEGKKELVIVNDYPLQNIIFDHPEVKIINLKQTFDFIGDKDNFAVENCSHDIISVWDDDDVAMPNHLENIAKYFSNDDDLLHWQRGVLFDFGQITAITSLGNSGIVFSKKTWKEVGGYPKQNAGHDMSFVMSIKHRRDVKVITASPPDEEVSWFYMWGDRCYHLSGAGTDTPDRPNIIQRHSEHIEYLRQLGKIPTGDIKLNPRWNKDYQGILRDYVNRKN